MESITDLRNNLLIRDKDLRETIQRVDDFNIWLSALNSGLKPRNEYLSFAGDYLGTGSRLKSTRQKQSEGPENFGNDELSDQSRKKHDDFDFDDHSVYPKNVPTPVENSSRIAEIIEKVFLRNEIYKNIPETIVLNYCVKCLANLFSGVEGSINAVERSAYKAMAGASISGARATFESIAADVQSETRDNKSGKLNPDRWAKSYWDQERQKEYERLTAYGRENSEESNLKQFSKIDKGYNKVYVVEERDEHVGKDLQETSVTFFELGTKSSRPQFLNKGQRTDNTFFQNKPAELHDLIRASEGGANRNIAYAANAIDTEEVNKGIAKYIVSDKYPAAGLSFEKPDKKRWRDPGLSTSEFKNGNKGQEDQRISMYEKGSPINNGASVINININKPMIENFTINAKEVKESFNDFKYKVEEVLVEILNSVNAIH
jgi:hypothetical protein